MVPAPLVELSAPTVRIKALALAAAIDNGLATYDFTDYSFSTVAIGKWHRIGVRHPDPYWHWGGNHLPDATHNWQPSSAVTLIPERVLPTLKIAV